MFYNKLVLFQSTIASHNRLCVSPLRCLQTMRTPANNEGGAACVLSVFFQLLLYIPCHAMSFIRKCKSAKEKKGKSKINTYISSFLNSFFDLYFYFFNSLESTA